MTVKFDLVGFDEFEKTLVNMIEIKYPEEVKQILFELAEELKNDAVRRTPEGKKEYYYSGGKKVKITKSKRMKNRWKVGKVKNIKGEFFIEVKNTAPHAHLIEDGHRIVTKSGKDVGFVQGQKVLLISVKKLEQRLEPRLQAWLNRMLEELSL